MRDLTEDERTILAHVVVDPDGWWAHASSRPNAEENLAAKVARWRSEYNTALLAGNYLTREQRDVVLRGETEL